MAETYTFGQCAATGSEFTLMPGTTKELEKYTKQQKQYFSRYWTLRTVCLRDEKQGKPSDTPAHRLERVSSTHLREGGPRCSPEDSLS